MTGTPIQLRDRGGRVVFEGTQDGGGGAVSGGLGSVGVLFTDPIGAGVLSATVPVLAGTLVVGVSLFGLGLGGETLSGTLDMGDTLSGPIAYLNGWDVGQLTGYDPATFDQANLGKMADDVANANSGPYTFPLTSLDGGGNGCVGLPIGVYYAADDAITLALTITSVGNPQAAVLVKVIYFAPVTPIVPTFTP